MNRLVPSLSATTGKQDDFEHWWTVPGEWVETPNERRDGWSGVIRALTDHSLCYVKRQRNHLCRTFSHPLGWPTASREAHFLDAVRNLGLRVPETVYHGVRKYSRGTEAVLATRALVGFTALSEHTALTGPQRETLATEMGRVLGVLHRARLQHGCLYDKHVMVRWQGDQPDIALLDLEKMRRRFSAEAAAKRDLDQLRRHQSILSPAEWDTMLASHRQTIAKPTAV